MGISELLLIALVVLIVFGPDKLPQLAKNIGKLTAKSEKLINQVKDTLNQQVNLATLEDN